MTILRNLKLFLLFCTLSAALSAQINNKNEMKDQLKQSLRPVDKITPQNNFQKTFDSYNKSSSLKSGVQESYRLQTESEAKEFEKKRYKLNVNAFRYNPNYVGLAANEIPKNTPDALPRGIIPSIAPGMMSLTGWLSFFGVSTGPGGGIRCDLSGNKMKLISPKSRNILKYVYGVNVDDHGRSIP